MKKGDIVVGPTPEELLKITVCHKYDSGKYRCGIVGIKKSIILSHDKWEEVTCSECLSLRVDN